MKRFKKTIVKKNLYKQNSVNVIGNLYRGQNNGESDCCSGSQSKDCYGNGQSHCCNN